MSCKALYAVYSKELNSDRWILRTSSVTTARESVQQHNKITEADRNMYENLAKGKPPGFTCGHSYQTRKISK